jgi:N6-adenosine-specific RNA methylase IME4
MTDSRHPFANKTGQPSLASATCSAARSDYRTILADPPWKQQLVGKGKARPKRARALPYPTMTVDEICALPIGELAGDGCHLWLWTTNEYLEAGFRVMRAWGFKYLAPITWVKPSGMGWFWIHRTQTMLMGYKGRCAFERAKMKPTVLMAGNPDRHSAKPKESYELIESISEPARVEIFARPWTPMFPRRDGWDVWGNEVPQDVTLVPPNEKS